MREKLDLKLMIIEVLKEDGMMEQSAKNIAYGSKRMNDLSRADRLSKNPHYISHQLWIDLYKGRNRVSKESKDT